jgi:iron uptake system EfeUOB component EfeO/EfeM
MNNLMKFYDENNNLEKMLRIINGESPTSLRIIDWFATNYAKKFFTVYEVSANKRFKVYVDYKLKLKAYSKRRFDPFCRWDRITIPYGNGTFIQTTIGQLNFFKWALENGVVAYIEKNYAAIEDDMNARNSTSRRNNASLTSTSSDDANVEASASASASASAIASTLDDATVKPTCNSKNKTRKKREELSVSATKSIKKETVEIVVSFN